VNGGVAFETFLTALRRVFKRHYLQLKHLSLAITIDHILGEAAPSDAAGHASAPSAPSPRLLLLNISGTSKFFKFGQTGRLHHLMKAAYQFNCRQDQYLLVTAFEGTNRRELTMVFEASGTGYELLTLPARAIDYSALLLQVVRPLQSSSTPAIAQLAQRISRLSDTKSSAPTPPWLFPAFEAALDELVHPQLFSSLVFAIETVDGVPPASTSTSTAFSASASASASSAASASAITSGPVFGRCAFSVLQLLQQLLWLHGAPPDRQCALVDQWMAAVRALIYSRIVLNLSALSPAAFLGLLAHVVLQAPVAVDDQPLPHSQITWRELERDGAIMLVPGALGFVVDAPFVMLELAASRFVRDVYDSVMRFLPRLTRRNPPTPRSNVECDLAIVTLRLVLLKSRVPALSFLSVCFSDGRMCV
jgi:hypothetical protein